MPEVRQRFHEELRAVEGEVQQTGAQARRLLEKALEALAGGDLERCEAVIKGDDEVDALYLEVERRILHLFALQTPVASDLRLLTALLHINLHLERVGDQAVNLAKITMAADGLPQNPPVLRDLAEMGAAAVGMVGAAMEALACRDLALAHRLPELDDPIDALNPGDAGQGAGGVGRSAHAGVGGSDVCGVAPAGADRRQRRRHRRAGRLPDYRAVPRVHRCFASGDRTP